MTHDPQPGPAVDLPRDWVQATVTTPCSVQHLHGPLDDSILNAFFLVPGQARRMELLGKLFRADEQMTANEQAIADCRP